MSVKFHLSFQLIWSVSDWNVIKWLNILEWKSSFSFFNIVWIKFEFDLNLIVIRQELTKSTDCSQFFFTFVVAELWGQIHRMTSH